ncbi:cytochrome c biogenesis CcdA family protein [Reyranella sp. CPCC 100927]|uniref:cytochrome c biogenesis CcdA family protein n=1 Tax=Reyranella sp. CPCC 100927 TaxID=2599616 RepID=UPI0011B77D7A|nr:cytochrome c biogenesis CcdA family protein [Reyranella sp. CPCC 100927]TWT04032.1 cytochrome c biogenesis protein CcdA [Reyranella sp. CPCC 100927]
MIEILLALLAGVLTVGAPCVLPMLPIILGGSIGQSRRTRPLFIAAGFALAFSLVALVFGAAADALGLDQEILRTIAIVMLTGFGLLMVWSYPFTWLMAFLGGPLGRAHAVAARTGSGNLGGLVLGATLGVLWTPCAGPVLASILTLIATSTDLARAAVLLCAYAIGASIPLLGIAYGGQYVSTRVRVVARHAHRVQQAFGVLVILVAVAMHYQYDGLITVWLSDVYPTARLGL